MPELAFDLHSWPGYPAPAVASAVRRAARSAARGGGVGAVHVTARSPFAASVNVEVAPNVSGVVTRAVESTLQQLREPARRHEAP